MIKAKKSLGQNFLIDNEIIKTIVNLIELNNKTVLEVGPGTGNLTVEILKKNPKKFIVIEKDERLASDLSFKFKNRLEIINKDILEVDETCLFKEDAIVFGNLPYNISTEILCKWINNCKNKFWFTNLVLMFQKEVADRIIAETNTNEYGRLSIISRWKLNVKKICDIKPECFTPKPKINSTLLFFTPKKNFYRIKNSKNLELVTRTFFNHRRKMLKKPYNLLFNGNQKILNNLNIDLSLRPQNINFDKYYQLAIEYENLGS